MKRLPISIFISLKALIQILIFFIGFTSAIDVHGQTVSRELNFAKYLMAKKNYDESVFVLKKLNTSATLTPIERDSIHFLLGNIYYDQKDLSNSIENFDLVSGLSHRLKSEAVFFSSFNSAYLKSYPEAKRKLLLYAAIDSSELQLKHLELAGVSLLQRDLKRFDSLSKFFTPINYLTDLQEKQMQERSNQILHMQKKSPLVAAMLSAILPGAGKFYAGNKGQGMYTLLISTIVGLQTWEAYKKDGPSSFRFIAYGTIFTSIYIGNIWGSTFAVKLKRDQFNETINDQILFDMHIPLRTLFH